MKNLCITLLIEPFDEIRWAKKIVKLYKVLSHLEKMKYLEPYFSKGISQLARYLCDTHFVYSLILT
jgi:hypothetical protein